MVAADPVLPAAQSVCNCRSREFVAPMPRVKLREEQDLGFLSGRRGPCFKVWSRILSSRNFLSLLKHLYQDYLEPPIYLTSEKKNKGTLFNFLQPSELQAETDTIFGCVSAPLSNLTSLTSRNPYCRITKPPPLLDFSSKYFLNFAGANKTHAVLPSPGTFQ